MRDLQTKHILIIDRQDHWRRLSAEALEKEGYEVRVLNHYDYSSDARLIGGQPPDLVILGCAIIGRDERELINKVLSDKRHLLVFCSSLPWGDMRSVFLAGADDVADKTYDPMRLTGIVNEAFISMEARDSYQIVEELTGWSEKSDGVQSTTQGNHKIREELTKYRK